MFPHATWLGWRSQTRCSGVYCGDEQSVQQFTETLGKIESNRTRTRDSIRVSHSNYSIAQMFAFFAGYQH